MTDPLRITLREKLARIIEPDAFRTFTDDAGVVHMWGIDAGIRKVVLAKADAILAALPLREALEALRPINMQDVRLCAGEGALKPWHVLEAVNVILASRARTAHATLAAMLGDKP